MEKDILNSKEVVVLNELAQNASLSQRMLARSTGISLGLVNAILRKLSHTGYVKATNLNKKKLLYLLTPQGFSAQASRSYNFVLSTIRHYHSIRVKIQKRVLELVEDGYTDFIFKGDEEVGQLIEIACREGAREGSNGIVLRRGFENCHDRSVFLKLGNHEIPRQFKGKIDDLTEVMR